MGTAAPVLGTTPAVTAHGFQYHSESFKPQAPPAASARPRDQPDDRQTYCGQPNRGTDLQFLLWAMADSNCRPLPCEGHSCTSAHLGICIELPGQAPNPCPILSICFCFFLDRLRDGCGTGTSHERWLTAPASKTLLTHQLDGKGRPSHVLMVIRSPSSHHVFVGMAVAEALLWSLVSGCAVHALEAHLALMIPAARSKPSSGRPKGLA